MPLVYEKNGKTYAIPDLCRQECEIWTRVMGYYRPVSDFNIGKKQEHRERVGFRVEKVVKRCDEEGETGENIGTDET